MVSVLLLLLSAALNTASSSEDSAGLRFTVTFPENIAFFHPGLARNTIYITALADNTIVEINSSVHEPSKKTLNEGQTEWFPYDANVELNKNKISNRSFQITSSKNIIVNVVSMKNTSMQTALIIPNDKLGKKYFIPPVPAIQRTTDSVTVDVTERQPFKLIIINTDQQNTVTVGAQASGVVSLEPHQVANVFITNSSYQTITAKHPVAVLFGHTCAMHQDCTCSLLYTTLTPAREQVLKFYIPTVVTKGAETETYILLSGKGSPKKERFNSNLPMVETAGMAILFRPGLLLNLIPKTNHAACYLIHALSDVDNFAVIVVHKDDTEGIHIGKSPLVNTQWEQVTSTDYVSTKVSLNGTGPKVIWHSSSTMAVYFQGSKAGTLFGNPATAISKFPDYRGCALTPEEIKIGDAKSWQESVKYCKDHEMELISLSTADHRKQIHTKINLDKDPNLQTVWIGMRRRSLDGWWYWLNEDPVTETNWAEEEPGTVEEGQCAIMSVERSEDFGWSDEDCCVSARPVCYRPPVLFPVEDKA